MELDRDLLREISRRLLGLHRILLDLERHAYEARHGAVSPGDLLRLLLSDAHFSWLRSLSTLIATMDELIDAEEPIASAEAQKMFGEVYRLLKSGDSGAFQRLVRYEIGRIREHAAKL